MYNRRENKEFEFEFELITVHILWIIKKILYLAAISKIGGLWLCSCIAVFLTISVPTSIQTEALHFKKSHFTHLKGAATKRWILQHLHHETVLAQKGLVTKNVWWCYMKCDVYILKILRLVQYTLCTTRFSNITSCDVNVRLRYVM
jgi:hypothetical protein